MVVSGVNKNVFKRLSYCHRLIGQFIKYNISSKNTILSFSQNDTTNVRQSLRLKYENGFSSDSAVK